MHKIMLTVLAGTALTLAACGSDSSSSTADPYNPPATVAGTTPAPFDRVGGQDVEQLVGPDPRRPIRPHPLCVHQGRRLQVQLHRRLRGDLAAGARQR